MPTNDLLDFGMFEFNQPEALTTPSFDWSWLNPLNQSWDIGIAQPTSADYGIYDTQQNQWYATIDAAAAGTGQTVEQIRADLGLTTTAGQPGQADVPYTQQTPTFSGTPPSGGNALLDWWNRQSGATQAGILLAGGLGGLGVAGIAQSLFGEPPSSTSTTTTNIPPPTAEQRALQQAALQALGLSPTMMNALTSGQANLPSSQTGLFPRLQARTPTEELAFLSGTTGLMGQQGALETSGLPATVAAGVSPLLTNQATALNQLQGASASLTQPSPVGQALSDQALGMAQGRLPALTDPAAQARINAIYEAQQQNINRYVDQSVRTALERSRQQGFAGGTEVFREGTPAALLAPALAEATRQRGLLAGQQAQSELDLAQQLPLLSSNLQQALVQQELNRINTLANVAGAYSTPAALRLQAFPSLLSTGGNLGTLLLNAGQQGITSQTDLIRAMMGLSGQQQQAQLAGAGATQTTTPASQGLLGAFAPLAQLLGGVGGTLSGIGALTAPRYSLFPTG